MVAGLIVIFLIGAPGLVSAVGHWVDVAGITQQRSRLAASARHHAARCGRAAR